MLGLQLSYQRSERLWLRWYDATGNWIPTPLEKLQQKSQRANKLAARLRELGISPSEL
ncbi:hypothetical protein WKK05_33605 [Nostoc sp. UHCC 0302]|uniref:hypothetical protein n=1 Tax=Nostoc sp. UHCC 0302 TaxID=3134896 RepID=UPI00311CA0FD